MGIDSIDGRVGKAIGARARKEGEHLGLFACVTAIPAIPAHRICHAARFTVAEASGPFVDLGQCRVS